MLTVVECANSVQTYLPQVPKTYWCDKSGSCLLGGTFSSGPFSKDKQMIPNDTKWYYSNWFFLCLWSDIGLTRVYHGFTSIDLFVFLLSGSIEIILFHLILEKPLTELINCMCKPDIDPREHKDTLYGLFYFGGDISEILFMFWYYWYEGPAVDMRYNVAAHQHINPTTKMHLYIIFYWLTMDSKFVAIPSIWILISDRWMSSSGFFTGGDLLPYY